MNNAFEYLLKAGGLMREEDYPYTARNGRCRFDNTKIAAKVANYSVIPVNEAQIAANLVKNGPLTGTVFSFIYYIIWFPVTETSLKNAYREKPNTA